MDAEQTLTQVLTGLVPETRENAKTFQLAVFLALTELGCTVRREVAAPYHTPKGARRGKVDIVVDAPFRAAIELDNWTPRDKSIRKLAQFDCLKFVALRSVPGVLISV